MITNCPKCDSVGCSYCNGTGYHEYAEFNATQDRMLKEAFEEVTRLKILLSRAQNCISVLMIADDDGNIPTRVIPDNELIQALMDDITTVLVSWK
jgi:hypothetical protein